MSIERDLRITLPRVAVPGTAAPVRVLLYGDLRAVTGARLVAEPVALSLRDRTGRVLSEHIALVRGLADTLEGEVAVPSEARGPLRLRAQLVEQPEALAAEVSVAVGQPRDTHPQPRSVRPLQRFSEAPVRTEPGAASPSPMRTRVEAGGCVPEQPCVLWVHVGDPAVTLSVTPSPSVSVVEQPMPEAQAIARAVIVVHGPEATTELVAQRGDQTVARRALRLPVTLGVLALSVTRGEQGARLRLSAEPGPCIVDAYVGGRWHASSTIAECAEDFAPPVWTGSEPMRVQLRRDPFASDSASVAVLAAPGASGRARLSAAAFARDPSDQLARVCHQAPDDCPSAADGYLLALLSEGFVAVPPPTSGMARAVGKLAYHQARLRWATLLSLALCGLSLAALVARRGLSGGAQARAWMGSTEDAEPRTRRAQRRGWLLVWACVAALMLAFVAVALYVVARSMA